MAVLNLKIAYYTSGVTGTGRIVRGIAIGNAFRRNKYNIDFTILHASNFNFLIINSHYNSIKIGPENIECFGKKEYSSSLSYKALVSLNPDILIVDLLWFPLNHFIEELPCKKIFLCRQVDDNFFTIPLELETKIFNSKQYDIIVAIEPFSSKIQFTHQINPIIIRNKNEILPKKDALNLLNIDESTKNCLLYFNGNPGDFEKVLNDYSYLVDEGYNIISTTNYNSGLFPAVDYFNAFDLIVCGAGYNSYWEAKYFNKDTIIIPTFATFESGERRLNECGDYEFEENGADQLVNIIMNL